MLENFYEMKVKTNDLERILIEVDDEYFSTIAKKIAAIFEYTLDLPNKTNLTFCQGEEVIVLDHETYEKITQIIPSFMRAPETIARLQSTFHDIYGITYKCIYDLPNNENSIIIYIYPPVNNYKDRSVIAAYNRSINMHHKMINEFLKKLDDKLYIKRYECDYDTHSLIIKIENVSLPYNYRTLEVVKYILKKQWNNKDIDIKIYRKKEGNEDKYSVEIRYLKD